MLRSLCLDSIPDDELLRRLSALVDRHHRLESELVAHIAEVDARKLYLARACSSMFAYCVEVLHLSEHEAYLRITCARASRRLPALLDLLADGRLHLSAIAKLAPHLSDSNAEALLQRAVHKTKREIEELCAEVAPREDVAPRMRKLPRAPRQPAELGPDRVDRTAPAPGAATAASSAPLAPPAAETRRLAPATPPPARPALLEPIAPARYKVEFTAGVELRDKLGRAQALLRHKEHGGDLAEVIDEAVTLLLGKLEARRFGKTAAPRKTLEDTDTSASSRYVPAAVKRVVHERDQGQCAFVDEATGRRCSCTDPGKLEYHHTTPFAMGSDHDPDKIELRCTAHNQHQAELDFGADKMARARRGTGRAREPAASYRHLESRTCNPSPPATLAVAGDPLPVTSHDLSDAEQAAASADLGATSRLSPPPSAPRRGPPTARARRGPPSRVRLRWFGRRRRSRAHRFPLAASFPTARPGAQRYRSLAD